jgi:hypothetical protein
MCVIVNMHFFEKARLLFSLRWGKVKGKVIPVTGHKGP